MTGAAMFTSVFERIQRSALEQRVEMLEARRVWLSGYAAGLEKRVEALEDLVDRLIASGRPLPAIERLRAAGRIAAREA